MSCSPIDLGGCLKEAGNSILESVAKSFSDAADTVVKQFTGLWLNMKSPDLSSPDSPAMWINGHLTYFVWVGVFCSILFAAYRLATTGDFRHAGELGQALGRTIVIGGLAGTLVTLGVGVGDAYSSWIMSEAKIDLSSVVVLSALSQPALLILVAIIVILAQLIQLGIMVVRNGMLVILAGVLPLASSASNTDSGRQWMQKAIAWEVAFILYKPVAATIYSASFVMAGKKQDISTQISGVFMMVLAILALPALMRFLVPATAAMSGGNAGAMAMGVVGGAVATGAVVATGGAAAAGGQGFAGAASGGAGGSSIGGAGGTASGASATGQAGGMLRDEGTSGGARNTSSGASARDVMGAVDAGRNAGGSAARGSGKAATGEDDEE